METTEQDELIIEQSEWLESLEAVIVHSGSEAAKSILEALDVHAMELGLFHAVPRFSPYRNTIPVDEQPKYPGNLKIEEKVTAILRWNALAMVMRANAAHGELGGHIASYASAAEIFEVGYNHFFKGGDEADLVYFQPHSAPGVYARAFLERRMDEKDLSLYRQEVSGEGLCSYPHPWLMPDFWQFPTGSMGLGPISAIYSARFMRYLDARGLVDTRGRHVWGVFGDGEMDEPESLAALTLASREKLNNLTFIINCNLQRLDGPVRGNGQIIPELEAVFQGAGWQVIKVLWGNEWDELFARDTNHALLKRFSETVDGKYQTLGANDGKYNLKHFFSEDPEVMELVSHMSDEQIDALKRGGHDLRKLFAAFELAKQSDKPTVILAKTKKGYGMGEAGESRMTAHQAKKMNIEGLLEFRNRFSIPLNDQEVEALTFYRPSESSEEMEYITQRRTALGGRLPSRREKSVDVAIPELAKFAQFALDGSEKASSTTMAIVRMLGGLLRDKELGPRIVPIVADEARTFGMANLFRQIGIYSPDGQTYEPEDSSSLLNYKEQKDGQLLEEGISEAGAMSSWIAAATSYSTHHQPMLPVYIYYSIFGFQRVGDLIWAAGDQRARGFLLGATAGKTTLSGEGLQHQDGTSQLIASTVPNCRSYDPCYAYEAAIIFHYGAKRMMEQQIDEFYYITVMNENYPQRAYKTGIDQGVIKGMYLLDAAGGNESGGGQSPLHVQLLGSGTILKEVEAAAELLDTDFGISSEIWSVTSFNELGRDGHEVMRQKRLNPRVDTVKVSYIEQCLKDKTGPVIAATDYVKQYAEQIRPFISSPYYVLGTDGYGRSDTRDNLRNFFEVDRYHIALTALQALSEQGHIPLDQIEVALKKYQIDGNKPNPLYV
ncbi:MAG: alpha-ketoglutarate dehydrogenase [Gammaproteobacteria bacterium]|nr:alpha-ketoglutarate dehydrogenase [Gammaproteobacteria bacterium]